MNLCRNVNTVLEFSGAQLKNFGTALAKKVYSPVLNEHFISRGTLRGDKVPKSALY